MDGTIKIDKRLVDAKTGYFFGTSDGSIFGFAVQDTNDNSFQINIAAEAGYIWVYKNGKLTATFTKSA